MPEKKLVLILINLLILGIRKMNSHWEKKKITCACLAHTVKVLPMMLILIMPKLCSSALQWERPGPFLSPIPMRETTTENISSEKK